MKKFFAVMICMMLALSLAACGGKDGQQTGGADNAAAPAATEAAEESAPAVAEGPWVLASSRFNSYMYTDFIYDENGQIVKEIWYNEERGTTGTDSYTYIPQDDGTTVVRRIADVEPINGYEFIYDQNGICIERNVYSSLSSDPEKKFSEENLDSRTGYEYDEAGRLIRSTQVNCGEYMNGSGTVIEYGYDENGRMISRTEIGYSSGDVISSRKYTYASEGYINHEVISSATFGESSYDYTYEAIDDIEHYGANGFMPGTERLISNRGGIWQSVVYGYNDENTLVSVTVSNSSGVIPAEYMEYFLGEGHRMEENAACKLTFMPLSLVLEQQNAQ